uniref:progesterone receptor n=1 Tax=Euleptes europaea TaxID=460621 RepID=UPI002541C4B8|nr:progesterone receptor [Euleptes europaea]
MTEMKTKGDPRAHASSSDPRDGSLLLRAPRRSDLGSFRQEAVEALDLSLDGLLYPKSSDDEEDREEEEEEEEEEDEPKAYLPEAEDAKGDSPSTRAACGSPADKDALDRVLDTFLAPSSPPASPPAAWSFFGTELGDFPGALMSRRPPDGKAGEASAAPLSPPAAAASSSSSSPWKAAKDADGAGFRSRRGKEAAAAAASAQRDASGPDLEGVPAAASGSLLPAAPTGRPPGPVPSPPHPADFLGMAPLPLNSAYLAARTRQLLDMAEYERGGPFGGPPPRLASPPPCGLPDFAHYAYSPKEGQPQPHYLFAGGGGGGGGDFQPALKIKEESLAAGAPAAQHAPDGAYLAGPASPLARALPAADYAAPPSKPGGHPEAAAASSSLESVLYKAEVAAASYGPAPCKASTSCIVPRDNLSLPSTSSTAPPSALYQPLALHGTPQLYPPYLSYIRSDAEAGQSPQYTFESLPQKICLICGDEASGCHYGVLTCGSCKVFFKRAMEGQHNYLCAGRNDCIVDKIRRKNCPACRLRKCCQAGMVLGGRKFKKFNKVKVLRTLDVIALQQPAAHPNDSQTLAQRLSYSPNQEIQYIPPLVSILQGIEPEVVYAGYDNTQPETPSALLTGLNQLCERQLLCVVKWSKSLPGFRNLHIDDQITLIQYSWMSLMVFAMGWRSYKHVSGQMLYFAPDLILNEQRMKESSFYSQCLSMWQIPQEFVKLQVSQEEFLCMKALLLLSTIPLEGLRSQNQFEEMRSSYIRELVKAIGLRQKGVVASSQRFYQLTKLMDSMHDLVKQLHLYCLNTFLQSRALSVEFPEMMSEVIAAQLPKILAGMVKPLLFHKK